MCMSAFYRDELWSKKYTLKRAYILCYIESLREKINRRARLLSKLDVKQLENYTSQNTLIVIFRNTAFGGDLLAV
jgi:hypothetical protein